MRGSRGLPSQSKPDGFASSPKGGARTSARAGQSIPIKNQQGSRTNTVQLPCFALINAVICFSLYRIFLSVILNGCFNVSTILELFFCHPKVNTDLYICFP